MAVHLNRVSPSQVRILVILAIGCIAWGIYRFCLYMFDLPDVNNTCLTKYPWKPPIVKNGLLRYETCVDGWTLCHIVLYFLTGVFCPHHYYMIGLISIGFEYMEMRHGTRARVSDILWNLVAYGLGSMYNDVFIKKEHPSQKRREHPLAHT